jgi:hypothetical protein
MRTVLLGLCSPNALLTNYIFWGSKMINEYGLKAPDSFWNMSREEIDSKYEG